MNPNPSNPLRFVSEANFDAQVLQSKTPVLVAFWAEWSKPCQVIDPVLLEIAEACEYNLEVVKVNADDNPELSLQFGVQHIPAFLCFEAGRLRGHLVGTVSKEAILSLLPHRLRVNSAPSRGEQREP